MIETDNLHKKELRFNLFCITFGALGIIFCISMAILAYQEEIKSNERKVELILDFIEKNYEVKKEEQ